MLLRRVILLSLWYGTPPFILFTQILTTHIGKHTSYELLKYHCECHISQHSKLLEEVSRIRILQDKIHKVINDIRDINNKSRLRRTNTHKYMANPNIYHNSGRTLLSGENHHPELDSLTFGEDLEDSSPDPSTSAECSTSMDDTSALSSSPSETGGRYAQSDPPPEMIMDSPDEEERGEIEDELESPEEQEMRGGT